MGQDQGHLMEMLIWLPGHQFNLSEIRVINGIKVIARSNCKCSTFYWQAGGSMQEWSSRGHGFEPPISQRIFLIAAKISRSHTVDTIYGTTA